MVTKKIYFGILRTVSKPWNPERPYKFQGEDAPAHTNITVRCGA